MVYSNIDNLQAEAVQSGTSFDVRNAFPKCQSYTAEGNIDLNPPPLACSVEIMYAPKDANTTAIMEVSLCYLYYSLH